MSVLSSALLAVRMFAPIWISFEKLPSSRESWSESVVVAKEVRLLETVVVPLLRIGGVELPEGHQVEELAVTLVLRR